MKAIVLVGGFGTRLRPLTLEVPKQMLPLVGVTMLERVVARLASFGVDEVVLSLGFQPDSFTEAFPTGNCAGVELVYAVEPEPLDTAGAIAFAAREAGIDEPVLAVNGDVLTDLDVAELWARHHERGAAATIALTPVRDPSRFGVVETDDNCRVVAFVEKPPPGTTTSNWINAGTYVLEPSVLHSIPAGRRVSIEREVFPTLVEEGSLVAMKSDAYWIDAGTPESYLRAHTDILDGVRGDFETAIDPGARIDSDAKVTRSAVGRGAVVAAGCEIVDSVVMPGALVGPGCTVVRSIIGGRSTIGAGCELSDLTVVGFDHDVPAGTVAAGRKFPAEETWATT